MKAGADKQLVCRRFRRALPTYARHALVQKSMALRLVAMIDTLGALQLPDARVLEFGCGSAMLTATLFDRSCPAAYFANDLVAESLPFVEAAMQGREPGDFEFLPGDIEAIDPLPGNLDLVVSNATLQWLHEPALFFERLALSVRAGGMVAFSTFGTDNMREIARLAHASLPYRTIEGIAALAGERFEVVAIEQDIRRQEFASPEAVLRHMHDTGVNGVARRAWSPSQYREFLQRYRADYPSDRGVWLTWHPVYCCFRRKNR